MNTPAIFYISIFCLLIAVHSKKFKDEEKPDWAKKDIRDFTDADMERLLDQWEVKKCLKSLYL